MSEPRTSPSGASFEDYETAQETAGRLGKSDARVRQLATSGRIPGAFKRGRTWWIPRSYAAGEAGIDALKGLSMETIEGLLATKTSAKRSGLSDRERLVLLLRLGLEAKSKGALSRGKRMSLRETARRMEMSHTQAWVLEGRAASKVRAALTTEQAEDVSG